MYKTEYEAVIPIDNNDTTKRTLNYIDLGLIDYKEAWDLQKEYNTARIKKEIQDTLFLLEHPNTYTLGKSTNKDNFISSQEFLQEHNISVYEIDRGGDITYHGPGQIVGYPIIDLNEWKRDSHNYLRALEEVIIKTCNHYNLNAHRNEKHTGVWIGNRKICAIGIKLTRWVTMHGFAFNVNTDLLLFNGIIPCGINDKEVTSMEKELGYKVNIQEVKEMIAKNFNEVFGYDT